MKRLKKILAMVLSLAMAMSMSVTAFAVPLEIDANAKADVVVNSVSSGSEVTAYKIVSFNTAGKYFPVKEELGLTILAGDAGKEWAPTAEQIQTIAQGIANGTITGLESQQLTDQNNNTFKGNLSAGMWVILVNSKDNETIYNPMIVSVQVMTDGTVSGGNVDASGTYYNVFAKSNTPTLDKKIVGSKTPLEDGTMSDNTDSTLVNPANNNGNDVAIGDTVEFEIEATIPDYSEGYQDVIVNISDQLSPGLSLNAESVTVSVNNQPATEGDASDYKYIPGNPATSGFTISFNSAYAIAHHGQTVKVRYEALLTSAAGTNFDENTNKATYEYTNNPSNKDDKKTLSDNTYTYTFEIDGKLDGQNSGQWNKVTEELLKGVKKTTTETGKWDIFEALKGAEFKLTNNKTGKVYTATSDEDGRMNFKGLDAGEYTLVETKAPAGYTIDNKEVPVKIEATYKADGRLESYKISVNNEENVSTYTAKYNTSDITKVDGVDIVTKTETTTENHISDSYIFWNTKLSELPSTGGIGTTIFTIGGCIIMIIAAGLFFASRRKKSEN